VIPMVRVKNEATGQEAELPASAIAAGSMPDWKPADPEGRAAVRAYEQQSGLAPAGTEGN